MSAGLKAAWSKHGALVLFIASQVCAAAAPYLAAKAAPKAVEARRQYEEEHKQMYLNTHDDFELENYEPPKTIELVKAGCYNSYLPALGVGLLGMTCGGMSFMHQKREIDGLANMYNVMSTSYNYLESSLKENVSKEKFDKIKADVAAKQCADIQPAALPPVTDQSKISCFKDQWSGQIFRADMETLRSIVNDINAIANNGERALMNADWYGAMQRRGIDISSVELGWAYGYEAYAPYDNVRLDIDVTQLSDGTPCGVVELIPKPVDFTKRK